MTDLRAACEHGRYETHVLEEVQGRIMAMGYECSGGREVTIDYEAATARLIMVSGWFDFPEGTEEIWARAAVDAAIGDGDDAGG